MIAYGSNRYEVVLQERYKLDDLLQSATLEDSLDQIAYRADLTLSLDQDVPPVAPGDAIRISGIPSGGRQMANLLHPGVIWECDSQRRQSKSITVTAYDHTIYLAKSEDEYLFPAGQTASERLRQYAADWHIPVANVVDTRVPLSKTPPRTDTIYSMIMQDLRETADKGGDLYRPVMTAGGLTLRKLGDNPDIWVMKVGDEANVLEISQNRTLEGATTRVKVFGSGDGLSASPLVAIETNGLASQLGTLQKVVVHPQSEDLAQTRQAARAMLAGISESYRVRALDLNTIRAGDQVILEGVGALIATNVRHELGHPGQMDLELATMEEVRRRYYARSHS